MPDFIVTLRGRPVEQLSLNLIEINIGRSPDNDIVLPNQSVSRKHATISSINQGYYIRALNHQNPIMVNGEECRQLHLRNGAAINPGCEIRQPSIIFHASFGCVFVAEMVA